MKNPRDIDTLRKIIPVCAYDADAFAEACDEARDVNTRLVFSQLEGKHSAALGALRRAAARWTDAASTQTTGDGGPALGEWLHEKLADAVSEGRRAAIVETVEVYRRRTLETFDAAIAAPVSGPTRDLLAFERERLKHAYRQVAHLEPRAA